MKHSWIAVLAMTLIFVLIVGALLLNPQTAEPVLTCGDYALDNTSLGYYYWSEYFYFSEAYGEFLSGTVDFSKPLQNQPYDETMSWEDFLLEETLNTVRDTMMMVFEAEAQGFVMPPEYEGTYQQVLVNFAGAATEGGYADLDAYLQASYGKSADRGSFEAYLRHTHLAAAYADHLMAESMPTDEEARAYFAEREAEYTELYDLDPADETTWLPQAKADLQQETYQNTVLTIRSRYPFLANPDNAVLTPPKGLYPS